MGKCTRTTRRQEVDLYPKRRARDRRTLGILLAAWIALSLATLLWAIPHNEDQLGDLVRAALDEENLLGVDATLSGRDATLSGVVGQPAELSQAIVVVGRIRGVRTVSADVTIDAIGPREATPVTTLVTSEPIFPTISIRPNQGAILLEGTVASQVTAAAINANATAAYGRVADDQLNVDPALVEPAWTADIATLLRGVGAIGGTLQIADGILTVTGQVADETARTTITEELVELAPGLQVDNQIELDPIIGQALFAIDSQPSGVVLRGTVDSEERIRLLVDAGEKIYGEGMVDIALLVVEGTELPSYLNDPDELFQSLEGRRLDLIVTEGGVYLRGVVPSVVVSESIAATVETLVGRTPVVNEMTVVEPARETTAAVAAINDLIGTSVTFQSGSTEITVESAQRLDEVAAILIARPELRGVVEGHTDDVGAEADNLALSEARARAVVRYLVEAGVAGERLTSIGFGESRPIAANSSEDGRTANRRIEFQVEGST